MNPERGLEDVPRMGRPSPITTDNNIEAVEQIVIRDRQISVRRLAEEMSIPKITIHDIMDNQLGMKKICTGWVLKLLHQFNVPIVWIVVKSSLKKVK